MQAARRLYVYAMAGITLAVIAFGLMTLIEVAISASGLLERPFDGGISNSRERLSLAVAMLGVGVPVWAIHWWWVQRGLAPGKPNRDAEHGSAIRAGFLSLVLLVSLLAWVSAASTLVWSLIWIAAGGESTFFYVDQVGATSTAAVGFIVWLYHGSVRRGDLGDWPVSGAAAWLPRLYLYGVSLAGLVIALTSLQSSVSSVLVPEFDEGYARQAAIQGSVSFAAWAVVWAAHWRYATRLAGSAGWRGVEEQTSRMRLGAFIATIVVAAGFSISAISELAQGVLAPMLGDVPYDRDVTFQLVIRPLASAIPWTVVWWLHVRWLRDEPAAAGPLRALHQVRLVNHGQAAIALAFGATGLGWVLGLAIDIAFGGTRRSDQFGIPWTFELARWLPMAVAGLAVWAWHWSRVLARHRSDPDGEAASTIRRAFLYLTLGVGVVVGLASATLILYRLVGSILGAQLSGNAVSELSTPLGAAMMAAVALAYHGRLLRADTARGPVTARAESAERLAELTAAAELTIELTEGVTVTEVRRPLDLVGPEGADLDAAIMAAGAALPPGIRLVPREP